MSRIADLPVYAQRTEELGAELYNLWRRARLHFEMPLRIPLSDSPGFVMILEENEWVCVDETQNDLPVLAWVAFEDQGRDALHVPVTCKLNYYHFAASKVRALALEKMKTLLQQRLHEDNNDLS
ncbi:MAG TPA: hypothetical protein ENJ65_07135 [Candidatus Tenderia electrophaga]|uniref:Uncharacterized protein n=1 Tax=Candidatus Tenderia electrophaga TaxID=1748243 RepID=A0A832J4V4_9GAMM|nr:hypothetical protein [Candidatus Tenderia electrophaga]